MTLIYTALLCEAMPIVQKIKLQKIAKNLYQNKSVVLLVGGIGEKNTKKSLQDFFNTHEVKFAINIGIAGCKDKNIKIGELFCINKSFKNIPMTTITSVQKPTKHINTTLADMEAKFFIHECKQRKIEYLVFKIVSDYLDEAIPKKEFVSSLIQKSLDKWIHLV